ADRRGEAGLRRAHADLADRVRLQLEAAQQVARRLERVAGTVRRRGGAARVSVAQGRPADPLPGPRRAQRSEVDERVLHEPRTDKALVQRVRAAVRAGVAARDTDHGLGPGTSALRRTAVPAPAATRRPRATGRRDASRP